MLKVGMEDEFSVTPGLHPEGFRVLVLGGELDMDGAPRLDAALDACTDGFPVIVDLSALTFIESAGLHALLKKRALGRPSAIVRVPASNVARVLDIVAADQAIPLYADLAEAIERLQTSA
jgi:anti-sigma B factor antagonist